MLLLQAFLKFSACGVLIAMLLLVVRDGRKIPALRYAIPLIISLLCLFLSTGHDSITVQPPWAIPLRMIDMLSLLFTWWFGLALFDDEFRLKAWHLLAGVAYALLTGTTRTAFYGFHTLWHPNMDVLVSLISIGFMLHLIWVALRGRHEDLIESRRRMRIRFAFALAMLIVVTSLIERFAVPLNYSPFLSLWIIYVATLLIGLWAVLWITEVRTDALAFPAAHEFSPKPATQQSPEYQRLVNFMTEQQGFRQQNLTIGKLAELTNVPSHQLRTLINQNLGYRNYTAFLNHFRLNAVKEALADSSQAKTPVLTLALDAGFASLAPFNRAFKDAEGITPTEYRRSKLQ